MSEVAGDQGAGQRIGILGGGQLASMLADAMGVAGQNVLVMIRSKAEPAAVAGHQVFVGDQNDPADLDRFLDQVDILTIENEFLDLPLIDAALERHPKVQLRPGRQAIAVTQDKLAQKRLFGELEIPTADFEVLHGDDLAAEIRRLQERFPGGFVLKWSRFGYDGRGNLVVRSGQDADIGRISAFCATGAERGAVVYAERMIDFEDELAMVSARGLDGAQVFLPLVITKQERGVCREVLGPAMAYGFSAALQEQAERILAQLGRELDFCGAFAVEFFVDREGRLLVNEMAPRVHNSGHYSLWPGELSQFELHRRAVSGAVLETTTDQGFVLMRNILGPHDMETSMDSVLPAEPLPSKIKLHWYGKSVAKRGRKMGHLTARAASREEANGISKAMADWEARYWSSNHLNDKANHDD